MNSNLAVLIDGDNIPSAHVKEMMEEIAKYGNPTIKRIYGDWTNPHLSKWKNLLLQNAITPIQQYAYTTGKNATDSAMIIDAMDILYSEKVNGFCLVSSDSDFTKLATRLREAGMQVIGIGEKKTPTPFIVACDKFIYIEILRKQSQKKEDVNAKEKIEENVKKSLMLVTALNPKIGYDKSAEIAKKAFNEKINLKEAAIKLNYVSEDEFDQIVNPIDMTSKK